jgi:hypothetical protein
MAWADVERILRLRKLESQLGNLYTTYSHARSADERALGESVPVALNAEAAAAEVRAYAVVAEMTIEPPVFDQVERPADMRVSNRLTAGVVSSNDFPAGNGQFEGEPLLQCDNPAELLRYAEGRLSDTNCGLFAITYRPVNDKASDVVIHSFPGQTLPVPKTVSTRNGNREIPPWMEQAFYTLGSSRGSSVGATDSVRLRQRAYEQLFREDTAPSKQLLEQPLRLIAVITGPQIYMPDSVGRHVAGIVAEAECSNKEWKAKVRLQARDERSAAIALRNIQAWREVGMAFVEGDATNPSRQQAAKTIQAISITQDGATIILTGSAHGAQSLSAVARLMGLASEVARRK